MEVEIKGDNKRTSMGAKKASMMLLRPPNFEKEEHKHTTISQGRSARKTLPNKITLDQTDNLTNNSDLPEFANDRSSNSSSSRDFYKSHLSINSQERKLLEKH